MKATASQQTAEVDKAESTRQGAWQMVSKHHIDNFVYCTDVVNAEYALNELVWGFHKASQ